MKQIVPILEGSQLLPFGYLSAQHFVEFLDYGPHLYIPHTAFCQQQPGRPPQFYPLPE